MTAWQDSLELSVINYGAFVYGRELKVLLELKIATVKCLKHTQGV